MLTATIVGLSLAIGSYVYQAFGAQDWHEATMRAWFQLSACFAVGWVDWLHRYSETRRKDPRENREVLRELILGELRDELRATEKSVREQMIADGWRQTRYVAPVPDCEACLTPDACAIRGQCAHYMRERRA